MSSGTKAAARLAALSAEDRMNIRLEFFSGPNSSFEFTDYKVELDKADLSTGAVDFILHVEGMSTHIVVPHCDLHWLYTDGKTTAVRLNGVVFKDWSDKGYIYSPYAPAHLRRVEDLGPPLELSHDLDNLDEDEPS